MSYQEDPTDPEWKTSKKKTVQGAVTSKPKYSQKFCEKWLNVFSPWLTRCEDDPHKPFCRACQCRLDCNRCHLQRHERTSKHARNLEILVNKGEGAARQNLSIRQERSKYYQQRQKSTSESVDWQEEDNTELGLDDYIVEGEPENDYGCEQTDIVAEDQYNQEDSNTEFISEEHVEQIIEPNESVKYSNSRLRKVVKLEGITQASEENSTINEAILPDHKEGMKLYMQIQKEKNGLMDSFKEFMGGTMAQNSPPREKNHVDLFFESVSSSVKALSPKLIAETKMRVSQLICELELRALNGDNESIQQQQQHVSTSLLVSPETNTPSSLFMNQSTGVAHAMQHHQSPHEDIHHY